MQNEILEETQTALAFDEDDSKVDLHMDTETDLLTRVTGPSLSGQITGLILDF